VHWPEPKTDLPLPVQEDGVQLHGLTPSRRRG
jgi:hypothetical protein